jgi:N-acetylmuramic acid 6-phosphate etherase
MSTQEANRFLAQARDFHLGILPTEQRHPKTKHLAELSRTQPDKALKILQKIDVDAISVVLKKQNEIKKLAEAMRETREAGGRIFFYGCGATGRLSLSLEHIWRFCNPGAKADEVRAFMSGGDLALVHSIENFEDHPEFGARQVREIGFSENDLLVSCTEGGETPSVIGATEEAVRISKRKPWFLYCNPDSVLKSVKRSRQVLENKDIEKICIFVGPMSLSGSTRLQATTVLQLLAGAALFEYVLPLKDLRAFKSYLQKMSYADITPFVEKESAAYINGEYFLYASDRYAITVVTDTTERSPTFSLPGFENQREPKTVATLAYAYQPRAKNAEDAWKKLLLREPLPLEWKALKGAASEKRLYGFDFSTKLPKLRQKKIGKGKKLHTFSISRTGSYMNFSIGKTTAKFNVAKLHPLCEHLFLKLLLNAHSTLVMGRLGRFESNVMTWVRPSNYKLIDRAARYTETLLEREKIRVSYAETVQTIFANAAKLGPADSVVLATVQTLKLKHSKNKNGKVL